MKLVTRFCLQLAIGGYHIQLGYFFSFHHKFPDIDLGDRPVVSRTLLVGADDSPPTVGLDESECRP